MVQTRYDPQGLLIQLETALHRLVESFWDRPYCFFTEADAVAGLQHWVATRPEMAQLYRTADSFEIGLLHREYPTFFRLDDQEPTQRLLEREARGHYDVVLLNPACVQNCKAEALTNRISPERDAFLAPPLLAAVEFKLFPDLWTESRVKEVRNELGKLRLSLEQPPDRESAYLCILQRDVSGRSSRWKQYWPQVERELEAHSQVRSVVAVCWPGQEREPFVGYYGLWQTTSA
jgi:hypothetical protein